jgi:hypothetical protein
MHRSGTSALTRVFSLLGADLPKSLVAPHPSNETGHWESQDLFIIHDDLLATAGSRYDDWRAFNPDWIQSGVAEGYRQKLLAVLQHDFAGSPLFVIKDPRICRFVPLWFDVLKLFGAEARVVIPVRNPLEVAASLKRRNNFTPAKSYLLWLRHVLDAEKATRQVPRAIVTYNDLLDDWRGLVGKVTAKTRLYWPRRSDRSELEIDQFLAQALRHHVADDAQLTARADVVDWVKEAYHLLQKMADKGETKDQFKRLDRIHSEFDKACATFGLVLASEAEQSESQLRSIETQIKARDEEVVRLSGDLTQTRSATSEAQASAAASHSQAAFLAAELEVARSVAKDSEIAIAEGEKKILEIGKQLAVVKNAFDELIHERKRLAAELDEERAGAARSSGQAALLGQELETIRVAILEHEAATTKLKANLDSAQSLSNDRKNEIDKLSRELRSGQSTILDRDGKIDQLSRDLDATRLFLRDSQSESQRLGGELDAARTEIVRTDAERQRISELLQAGREALFGEREKAELAQALVAREVDLAAATAERDRLVEELARTVAENHRVAKSNADRAAALAENENKEQAQIRALRDQLVDAEAALAKSRTEQGGLFWMRLFFSSKRGIERLIKSGLFDTEWYLREYPDVAQSRRPPAEHYLEEGYLRGYRPNSLFDTRWYLERYEDVRRSGMNPLLHYLMHGCREGRDPGPDFQTSFYLEANPDVRSNGMNPLAHYMHYGRHEGRLPVRPA